MAYFNDNNNTDFYPTFSASGELGDYQFLNQALATGEEYAEGWEAPWGTIGQPGSMVGPSTGLRATASYGEHYYSSRLLVDG